VPIALADRQQPNECDNKGPQKKFPPRTALRNAIQRQLERRSSNTAA